MRERETYNPHAAGSVSDAYAAGRAGVGATYCRWYDVRDAIDSWTSAQGDHGHTSYWGVVNIRKSRAYFLGLARYWRSGDASRFLAGV